MEVVFGATFAFVTGKIGISGAALPSQGVKLEFKTMEDGKIGATMECAGAEVKTWTFKSDN